MNYEKRLFEMSIDDLRNIKIYNLRNSTNFKIEEVNQNFLTNFYNSHLHTIRSYKKEQFTVKHVQNITLFQRFCNQISVLQSPYVCQFTWVYHGTTVENAFSICKYGFNLSKCTVPTELSASNPVRNKPCIWTSYNISYAYNHAIRRWNLLDKIENLCILSCRILDCIPDDRNFIRIYNADRIYPEYMIIINSPYTLII